MKSDIPNRKNNHLFKIEINQPMSVKRKMKWCKLGSGVRW